MYALNVVPRMIDEQVPVSKNYAIDKGMLWHHCLGHPRQNVTRQLGVDVLEMKCKACEMAKSHRQPFNKQVSHTQEALKRVYSDLVDPFRRKHKEHARVPNTS